MNETNSSAPQERGNRKHRVGMVVSDVQNKTIIVEVMRRAAHKKYKKVVKVRTRYAVHDETNQAKVGDTVRIGVSGCASCRMRQNSGRVFSSSSGETLASYARI